MEIYIAFASVLLLFLIKWALEYRYFIEPPRVNFIENEDIRIGLYPGDYEAAFLFSVDDLHDKVKDKELDKVLALLDETEIRATFFVIPFFREKFMINMEKLEKIAERNHEIAQHGYSHRVKKKLTAPWNITSEFKALSYDEQERRIKNGKKIFEKLGFRIYGFRTPHFSSGFETLELLAKHGFAYVSDVRIWPEGKITNKRFLGIVYGSIYYPYFIKTKYGEILMIPTHGDYIWDITRIIKKPDLFSVKKRLAKYYNANGTFCLLTHIHKMGLNSKNGISFVKDLAEEINSKKFWKTTMKELALWWIARAKLKVRTEKRKNRLLVYLEREDNNEEYRVKNLCVEIKKDLAYEIYLKNEKIKSGEGAGRVYVSI